jgi:DNA-binding NarL/FixJ family response regulator
VKNVILYTPDEEKSAIKGFLIDDGYEVAVYTNIESCIQAAHCWDFAGLFIDACEQKNKQATCLSYCAKIKRINPQFPIILFIPEGDISLAVKAAQIGIKHILEKNLQKKDFSRILNDILPDEKPKHVPLDERLTANEKRIVEHILNGYTNKEISEQLDRSIRTIEEHRANIMKKLCVENTVDLLNRSLQVGIIDAEDITPPRRPNTG